MMNKKRSSQFLSQRRNVLTALGNINKHIDSFSSVSRNTQQDEVLVSPINQHFFDDNVKPFLTNREFYDSVILSSQSAFDYLVKSLPNLDLEDTNQYNCIMTSLTHFINVMSLFYIGYSHESKCAINYISINQVLNEPFNYNTILNMFSSTISNVLIDNYCQSIFLAKEESSNEKVYFLLEAISGLFIKAKNISNPKFSCLAEILIYFVICICFFIEASSDAITVSCYSLFINVYDFICGELFSLPFISKIIEVFGVSGNQLQGVVYNLHKISKNTPIIKDFIQGLTSDPQCVTNNGFTVIKLLELLNNLHIFEENLNFDNQFVFLYNMDSFSSIIDCGTLINVITIGIDQIIDIISDNMNITALLENIINVLNPLETNGYVCTPFLLSYPNPEIETQIKKIFEYWNINKAICDKFPIKIQSNNIATGSTNNGNPGYVIKFSYIVNFTMENFNKITSDHCLINYSLRVAKQLTTAILFTFRDPTLDEISKIVDIKKYYETEFSLFKGITKIADYLAIMINTNRLSSYDSYYSLMSMYIIMLFSLYIDDVSPNEDKFFIRDSIFCLQTHDFVEAGFDESTANTVYSELTDSRLKSYHMSEIFVSSYKLLETTLSFCSDACKFVDKNGTLIPQTISYLGLRCLKFLIELSILNEVYNSYSVYRACLKTVPAGVYESLTSPEQRTVFISDVMRVCSTTPVNKNRAVLFGTEDYEYTVDIDFTNVLLKSITCIIQNFIKLYKIGPTVWEKYGRYEGEVGDLDLSISNVMRKTRKCTILRDALSLLVNTLSRGIKYTEFFQYLTLFGFEYVNNEVITRSGNSLIQASGSGKVYSIIFLLLNVFGSSEDFILSDTCWTFLDSILENMAPICSLIPTNDPEYNQQIDTFSLFASDKINKLFSDIVIYGKDVSLNGGEEPGFPRLMVSDRIFREAKKHVNEYVDLTSCNDYDNENIPNINGFMLALIDLTIGIPNLFGLAFMFPRLIKNDNTTGSYYVDINENDFKFFVKQGERMRAFGVINKIIQMAENSGYFDKLRNNLKTYGCYDKMVLICEEFRNSTNWGNSAATSFTNKINGNESIFGISSTMEKLLAVLRPDSDTKENNNFDTPPINFNDF